MKDRKSGVTLVEVIAVLVIIATMAAVSIPKLTGYISEVKGVGYVLETNLVAGPLQMYLTQERIKGTLNWGKMYQDLQQYPLSDKRNVLNDILGGSCTTGAELQSVNYTEDTAKLNSFTYTVGGYEVEFSAGIGAEVIKRK